MVADIGYVALVMAFVVTLYGMVAGILAYRWRRSDLVESARRALHAYAMLVTLATLSLVYLLLTDHFRVKYVAEHSERALPPLYKISALWGGQEGSLLLWVFILGLYVVAAAALLRDRHPELNAHVYFILHGVATFFLGVLLFAANPFTLLTFTPPDGNGLNPLLQNYWMILHPFGLYLGYIGFTIPFAYAMAALLTAQVGNTWVRTIRRWTLIPWMFLSLGILMGSLWAYRELGWGGYWVWDPVENASLMPWLTGAAFLHSIMIQERRGMLKVWNVVLIFLTFWLTIFGTFLTRSGIIESIHAFVLSNVGPLFLGFLALLLLGFLAVLWWRWPVLRSEHVLEAMLSRESAFWLNNVFFTAIALITLLGTTWPILSELVVGDKIGVGASFFNRVNGPIFAGLLGLMGIGPLLPWRRASWATWRGQLVWPVIGGGGTGTVFFLLGERRLWPLAAWAIVGLVLVSIAQEYVRGVRSRVRATGEPVWRAMGALIRRNPRRYGGYIVHLGVILAAIGIIGSSFYQSQQQGVLRVGEALTIGDYRLVYNGLFERRQSNHTQIVGRLAVYRDDAFVGVLEPARNIYDKWPEQPTSEVAVRVTWKEDLYVVLAGWERGGEMASFKAYINPLMAWLWIGGLVSIAGTLIAWWPVPQQARVRVRTTRDLLPHTG